MYLLTAMIGKQVNTMRVLQFLGPLLSLVAILIFWASGNYQMVPGAVLVTVVVTALSIIYSRRS